MGSSPQFIPLKPRAAAALTQAHALPPLPKKAAGAPAGAQTPATPSKPPAPSAQQSTPPASQSYLKCRLQIGDQPPQTLDLRQNPLLVGSASACDVRLPEYVSPPVLAALALCPQGIYVRRVVAEPKLHRAGSTEPLVLLRSGEEAQVGPCKLAFHFDLPGLAKALAAKATAPAERPEALAAERKALEEERRDWEQEAERQAEGLALRARQALDREKELARREKELAEREAAAQAASAEQAAGTSPPQNVAGELAALRDQLYGQYAKRRDHVLALKASVDKAAKKVQEEKRGAQALLAELKRQQEEAARRAEAGAAEGAKARAQSEAAAAQWKLVEEWQQELEAEQRARESSLGLREQTLAAQEAALAKERERLAQDLERLRRLQESLEARDRELAQGEAVFAPHREELARVAVELESQGAELKRWEERLEAERDALAARTAELRSAQQESAGRLAEAEGKLAEAQSVRGAAEQLRTELEQRDRVLSERRWRVEEAEQALRESSRKLAEEQAAFLKEQEDWRASIAAEAEQRREMAAAVAKFRAVQDEIAAQDEARGQAAAELEARAADLERREQELAVRADRLARQRQRHAQEWRLLRADRDAHEEAEGARERLQLQLHRRGELLREQEEELSRRRAGIDADRQRLDAEQAAWRALQAEADAVRTEAERRLSRDQSRLAEERETLEGLQAELARRGQALEAEQARLEALAASQAEREAQLHAAAAELEEQQKLFAEILPARLAAARGDLAQLAQARAELRAHLDEAHSFSANAQASLAAERERLQRLAEEVHSRAEELSRDRSTHQLEVSRFKLFLGEWHEQWRNFRAAIETDEAALSRREQELAALAERLQGHSGELEIRLEALGGKEESVAERKESLARHLSDLQTWHQEKVQELAAEHLLEEDRRDVLPLHAGLTEADQSLAQRLLASGLVDEAALEPLLEEARRLRCPLREALLNGERLTAFQLAQIEAGRAETLALGSLRLLDELRSGPPEAIYRVFDAERGVEALLRRLDPSVPAEQRLDYQASFAAAAAVDDPHVARTLAVLEGGSAVLQEWPQGLTSGEWKNFAGAPRVWLRLLRQATQGLAAIHAHGMVHGRLHSGRLLLTPDGVLKVCGLGEPAWLLGEPTPAAPRTPSADLRALAKVAFGWLGAGKPSARVGNEALLSLLRRFDDPQVRPYVLLELIDAISRQLGGTEEAWLRLLAFVRARMDGTAAADLAQAA